MNYKTKVKDSLQKLRRNRIIKIGKELRIKNKLQLMESKNDFKTLQLCFKGLRDNLDYERERNKVYNNKLTKTIKEKRLSRIKLVFDVLKNQKYYNKKSQEGCQLLIQMINRVLKKEAMNRLKSVDHVFIKLENLEVLLTGKAMNSCFNRLKLFASEKMLMNTIKKYINSKRLYNIKQMRFGYWKDLIRSIKIKKVMAKKMVKDKQRKRKELVFAQWKERVFSDMNSLYNKNRLAEEFNTLNTKKAVFNNIRSLAVERKKNNILEYKKTFLMNQLRKKRLSTYFSIFIDKYNEHVTKEDRTLLKTVFKEWRSYVREKNDLRRFMDEKSISDESFDKSVNSISVKDHVLSIIKTGTIN